jgi:hypothetical protein
MVKIALNQTTTIEGIQDTSSVGPMLAQSDSVMRFQVGASSIIMTPASITLTSPSIELLSASGVVAVPITETIIVPPV